MVFLNGDAIPEPDAMGRRISDDHFVLLFNAHTEPIDFTLPQRMNKAGTYDEKWAEERFPGYADDIDWTIR